MAHPIICPSCEKETSPFEDMDPDKAFVFIQKCGNEGCHARLPASLFAARGVATPRAALATVQVQPALPIPAAPVAEPPRTPGQQSASALVTAMRERLAAVEALLAVKTTLEEERDLLRRMLEVADPSPPKALN